MTDKGDSVVLDNGIVSATIAKAGARVTSLVYRGNQMGDRQGLYWGMGGGMWTRGLGDREWSGAT